MNLKTKFVNWPHFSKGILKMLTVRLIDNNKDLDSAFSIRRKVFVEEQQVDPDLEYDEFENSSFHYLAINNGEPVGTARWRMTEKGVKLERFAVLDDFRIKGVGKGLLKRILEDVHNIGSDKIYLHAQVQVIPFYEKYGFACQGAEFTEAGIRHRKMEYVGL